MEKRSKREREMRSTQPHPSLSPNNKFPTVKFIALCPCRRTKFQDSDGVDVKPPPPISSRHAAPVLSSTNREITAVYHDTVSKSREISRERRNRRDREREWRHEPRDGCDYARRARLVVGRDLGWMNEMNGSIATFLYGLMAT